MDTSLPWEQVKQLSQGMDDAIRFYGGIEFVRPRTRRRFEHQAQGISRLPASSDIL